MNSMTGGLDLHTSAP